MMARLVGAGLVVWALATLGALIAGRFERRCRELRTLLHALSLLETEIAYGRRALPEAVRVVAEKVGPPATAFLLALLAAFRHPQGSLAAMWERALAALAPSALGSEEVEALGRLGQALGRSGEAEEVRHLRACQSELQHILAQVEAEAARKARLWRTAGVVSGLAVALLLL
jgi:stage III sporulation protein AB